MRAFIAAAAALAIAACAEAPKQKPDKDWPDFAVAPAAVDPDDAPDCRGRSAGSNRDNCTILVNVSVSDSTCTVTVGAGQDAVEFARGASNVWVIWQLDVRPSRYRFASRDGIKFKNDSRNNFTRCKAFGNDQLFRCRNTNGSGDAGEYDYGINIVDGRGNLVCPGDPKIINR